MSDIYFRFTRMGRVLGAALASAALLAAVAPAASAQTLREAVHTALTDNPTARAAEAEVRASALELLQLEEEFLPSITLSADLGAEYYDEDDAITDPETRFARDVSITADLVLFDGYRRANQVWRNAARLDGAIFRLLDASETLALSAVRAYVDVARHNRLLAISDQNVSRHLAIERQVEERVEGGRQPTSANFEVDDRVLAARMARLQVQNALADAQASYRAVVGRQPGVITSVPLAKNLPPSLEAATARAVGSSFRVQAAETVIRSRTYEKGATEAQRKPQVSLQAGARHAIDRFGSDGADSDAFVGLQLRWDLYKGGRKAQSGALAQRVRAAEAERNEAVREAQKFVAEAWNAYQTAQERAVLLDVRRGAAGNVVAQYRQEFRAGTRTLLDVLDAERTLYNVRFEAVNARAALEFNGYRLLAAQSQLAEYFGVAASDMALMPGFEGRARSDRPAAIFNTEIRALE